MTNIILLTMMRSGSSYSVQVIRKYFRMRHKKHFVYRLGEQLDDASWTKNRGIHALNTTADVRSYLSIKGIPNNEDRRRIFIELLNRPPFVFKVFPEYTNVVSTEELRSLTIEKDLTVIPLYRKSIVNRIVSNVVAKETNKRYTTKSTQRTAIKFQNLNEDVVDKIVRDTIDSYVKYHEIFKIMSTTNRLREPVAYEDLSFNPEVDILKFVEGGISAPVESKKLVSTSVRNDVVASFDIENKARAYLNTVDLPVDENLNYLIGQ